MQAWELIDPRTELTTIILLSGHSIKLSSEFVFEPHLLQCSSQASSEMFLYAVDCSQCRDSQLVKVHRESIRAVLLQQRDIWIVWTVSLPVVPGPSWKEVERS